jgi:hypothetical protein
MAARQRRRTETSGDSNSLIKRHSPEPKARLAFYREEAVGCSDIARSLEARSGLVSLAGHEEVPGSLKIAPMQPRGVLRCSLGSNPYTL